MRVEVVQRGNFDLIFSTAPAQTGHLVAKRIAEITKLPWIADFRYVWLEYGRAYNHWEKIIVNRMLYGIIKESSYLTFTSKSMFDNFQGQFKIYANKMVYVPHGIIELPKLTPIEKADSEIWLGYIGTLDYLRDPRPLINMLIHMKMENEFIYKRIRIKLVGTISNDMHTLLSSSQVWDRFDIVGFVTRKVSLQWMCSCDYLVLLLSDISNIGYGASSSKVYDYLAANKPILAFVPAGSVSKLIAETGGGRCFQSSEYDNAASWIIQSLLGNDTLDLNNEEISKLRARNIGITMMNLFYSTVQISSSSNIETY